MLMMKKINYYLGRLLDRFGYRCFRKHQVPECNLELLRLGIGFLEKTIPSLKIVQIGAFDGRLSDPLQAALRKGEHQVVLVEPQPQCFELLRERYSEFSNVKIVNAAVTEEDGEIKMYLPKNEKYSPKATVDRDQLKNFGENRNFKRPFGVECEVPNGHR
jgi:FkbM family methyltransferase